MCYLGLYMFLTLDLIFMVRSELHETMELLSIWTLVVSKGKWGCCPVSDTTWLPMDCSKGERKGPGRELQNSLSSNYPLSPHHEHQTVVNLGWVKFCRGVWYKQRRATAISTAYSLNICGQGQLCQRTPEVGLFVLKWSVMTVLTFIEERL